MMSEIVAREVLLLHGFTHTGNSWEPVVRALGKRYRALAPDIRGHGEASERFPVDLAAVLADLEAQLDPGSTLVGYSMGGRLALHLAAAQPGRIGRLVLIGASPGIADEHERAARRAADEELASEIEHLSIEEFARRWARTPVLAGLPAEVAEQVIADRLRNTPKGLARALTGLGTGALPSLWDRLGELSMPVMLVVGERDQKFREIASRMAESLPDAQLVVVSGVGHAVHLEVPERVAEVIAGRPGPPDDRR
jgi:2-succinyl-6-hydroxy-2,4-cyclohexadiene-1-carboxylate synthase